jgi:hypothetical protein
MFCFIHFRTPDEHHQHSPTLIPLSGVDITLHHVVRKIPNSSFTNIYFHSHLIRPQFHCVTNPSVLDSLCAEKHNPPTRQFDCCADSDESGS